MPSLSSSAVGALVGRVLAVTAGVAVAVCGPVPAAAAGDAAATAAGTATTAADTSLMLLPGSVTMAAPVVASDGQGGVALSVAVADGSGAGEGWRIAVGGLGAGDRLTSVDTRCATTGSCIPAAGAAAPSSVQCATDGLVSTDAAPGTGSGTQVVQLDLAPAAGGSAQWSVSISLGP